MQHDVIHIGRPKKKCVYLGKASVGGCQRSWLIFLFGGIDGYYTHNLQPPLIKGFKKYTANNALGH